MRVISYTSARSRLANTMTHVCEDHEPVIITRSKADPVVMLSLEDYESLKESAYLFSSPENAKRLMESMEEIEAMIEKKKEEK